MITRLRLGREIVLGVLLSVNLQFTRIAVDFLFLLKLLKKQKIQTDKYRKSSIKPPPGGGLIFLQAVLRGSLKERGALFTSAKRITCSKNIVVTDRVDLRFVQLKSLSTVFNSLIGA